MGGFRLLETSAAYWRGDEENETLTRVYGTAFASEGDLGQCLTRVEEAEERDHRKLGKELDLFSIDETTGPGLPLYHPQRKDHPARTLGLRGRTRPRYRYDEVETPDLFRTELWKKSGRYDNYVDDMFLLDVNDEEYGLNR